MGDHQRDLFQNGMLDTGVARLVELCNLSVEMLTVTDIIHCFVHFSYVCPCIKKLQLLVTWSYQHYMG